MARMRVTMMLADAAQESGGKLFILGGGWSVTGPTIPPSAVALKIDVPWDQANRRHHWVLELVTEDGDPVVIEGEALRADGEFEVGRPPGIAPVHRRSGRGELRPVPARARATVRMDA
jgi:hypothetical protein